MKKFKVNVIAKDKDNDNMYQWICYMKYSKLIRFLKRVFAMDEEITCIEVQYNSFHFYARRMRYSSHMSFRIYENDFTHSRITVEL